MGLDRALWVAFLALLALDFWALWAHHALGWPYAHKGVFLFHFDFERNLPTAFTVGLLLQASWLSGSAARSRLETRRVDRGAWWLLAGLFALLAVDEGFVLHERLIEPVGARLPDHDALTFAWIVPYGAAVLVLGVALWGWMRRLPRDLRRALQASAAVYLAGALGLEAVGGWILGGDLAARGLGYDLVVTLEESLEMIGLLLFAHAVRRYRGSPGPNSAPATAQPP